MLQDEEEDQKKNMQIRSHSVGAKRILGHRSLNVESAAGMFSGAVKSPHLLQIYILCSWFPTYYCIKIVGDVVGIARHQALACKRRQ